MRIELGTCRWRSSFILGSALALALGGCSSDDTPKAWNALATCLAGKAAASPLAARVLALRAIQLGNAANNGAKDAWPKRCAAYADDLFATLPTSGDTALLRNKLREKFNCNETKGSCTLPADSSLLSISTELWDAAKAGGLSSEVAANVTPPAAAPAPLLDGKSWKPLTAKTVSLSGPLLTSDGRGVLVMKSGEGRARPSACEFNSGFNAVHCFEANASVPELPIQSIEIVNDAKGVFAAGLTDSGLVGYDLRSGDKVDVRGRSGHLIRDGVVVEKGTQDELSQEPPKGLPGKPAKGAKKAKAKAKADVKEEGFVAVELRANKASKEIKLPIKTPLSDPIALADQILYLNPVEGGADLVVKSLAHARLKDVATIKGKFSGAFHSCQKGANLGVATFAGRAAQPGSKPTSGSDKTQFSVALYQNGAWSKAGEATLPFERAFESGLVCTNAGASLVWVSASEGGAQVGRIDCNAEGCKSSDVKLAGLESKWWWGVGPLGDKLFVMWRAALGETRLRVGSLGELANAKDVIVFDAPDFGGPTAGELSTLIGDAAALFVFRNEQPVALRLAADGALGVLAP